MKERTLFDKAFQDLTVTAKNMPDSYNLLHQRADRVNIFRAIEKSISDMTTSAGMFDVSVGVETEENQSLVELIDDMDAALKALQGSVSQIEGGGSVPDDLVNRLGALETESAAYGTRLDTLETNETEDRTRSGNIERDVWSNMNRSASNEALLNEMIVEDPERGHIIEAGKLVDSMLASGLVSTDTSGGGTSAGGRMTEVLFTQNVDAATQIELNLGAYASYTVTGDEVYLPSADALDSSFVRFSIGLDIDKSRVTFVNTHSVRFDFSFVPGTKLLIYS